MRWKKVKGRVWRTPTERTKRREREKKRKKGKEKVSGKEWAAHRRDWPKEKRKGKGLTKWRA
jgi:hypothetical protein